MVQKDSSLQAILQLNTMSNLPLSTWNHLVRCSNVHFQMKNSRTNTAMEDFRLERTYMNVALELQCAFLKVLTKNCMKPYIAPIDGMCPTTRNWNHFSLSDALWHKAILWWGVLQFIYMQENCTHCVHAGLSVAKWRMYLLSPHKFEDSFI